MLAKFGLGLNCLQKLVECLLAHAGKIFTMKVLLACSDSCYNSLSCNESIICFLETKIDTGNNISYIENLGNVEYECFWKHEPRFIETDMHANSLQRAHAKSR